MKDKDGLHRRGAENAEEKKRSTKSWATVSE